MYSTTSELNRSHIDLQDATEMRFWCAKLGCGDMKLKEAVRAVGHAPYHVERYLRQARVARGFERRH